MNWDHIEGQWKQITGQLQERWGRLTHDDIDIVAGRRDQLVGKIQERYGVAKEEAEQQIASWQRQAGDAWAALRDRNATR